MMVVVVLAQASGKFEVEVSQRVSISKNVRPKVRPVEGLGL
jgi:hypothetical protein